LTLAAPISPVKVMVVPLAAEAVTVVAATTPPDVGGPVKVSWTLPPARPIRRATSATVLASLVITVSVARAAAAERPITLLRYLRLVVSRPMSVPANRCQHGCGSGAPDRPGWWQCPTHLHRPADVG